MGSSVPYVAVRVGNFRGITRHIDKKDDPEWNQVFAFSKDSNLASMIEVTLNSKDCSRTSLWASLRSKCLRYQNASHRIVLWLHSGISWRITRGTR
ncbi:hypothetical protein HPP92_022783 [Vanilla planifolia]|uniref:C2 domain-containing protein n=1 Tax=Vanilla planifolia TaxID=51239 RepID=A0A835PP57_VANPL|nr:hypothetical protein HPP92_022783 [Vanilla planifolia]